MKFSKISNILIVSILGIFLSGIQAGSNFNLVDRMVTEAEKHYLQNRRACAM